MKIYKFRHVTACDKSGWRVVANTFSIIRTKNPLVKRHFSVETCATCPKAAAVCRRKNERNGFLRSVAVRRKLDNSNAFLQTRQAFEQPFYKFCPPFWDKKRQNLPNMGAKTGFPIFARNFVQPTKSALTTATNRHRITINPRKNSTIFLFSRWNLCIFHYFRL